MPGETIVLIHGLWMTPRSWEGWQQRFESRGHRVIAPAWPGLEAEVEALRSDPTPLTKLDGKKIVDHYEGIVRALDSPPIIMGHSFGGAFTQILLDRGLGAAGVGVHAATLKGIPDLPLSTIKSTLPVLSNPFNRGKATALTPKQFHYAFANTLSEEDSQKAYDRYHVPAANRVLFEGAFANLSPKTPFKIDWANPDRAPLLLIGGGEDHIIPAKVTEHLAKKHGKSPAVTDLKVFPGRSHYTVGEEGWEEVADYALDWATKQAATRAAA